MKNPSVIGCPMGQTAWVNLVLKFPLTLLLLSLLTGRLLAQCHGVLHSLDEFDVTWHCSSAENDPQVQVIEFHLAGTTNATQIVLSMESDSPLPKIDNIQLQWVGAVNAGIPVPRLDWSQEDNGKRLLVRLVWDPCSPVFLEAFQFQLIAACGTTTVDPFQFRQVDGGIVQVDVIQAKTAGMETQQIFSLDGVLLREVVAPRGAAAATEGLHPGMYLVRRISQPGQIPACERVFVR